MKTDRRKFLKATAQTLAFAPLMPALPAMADTPPAPARLSLNVHDLGALGDGQTKDTLALQQALDRASLLGGGEVFVPPGNYLTGTLQLRSNVTLRLDAGASLLGSPDLADYPFTQVRWEGRFIKGHSALITAQGGHNFGIAGKGKIVGSRAIKGRLDAQTRFRNPALIELVDCTSILIEDCFTDQNDMWSIHPLFCDRITFRNVQVHSGADGIDIDSCTNVVIDGCTFVTRDDCISLKSGRGFEGNTLARPTLNVRIANCTFSDAVWACIGIGSETSGGIRGVRIEHCKCLAAKTFAIYIKSRPGRGAFIEDIAIDDLDVADCGLGFLRFNILNSGLQDPQPIPGDGGIPTVKNWRFSNIRVAAVPTLVEGSAIHPHKPLDGLTVENITGTCGKGIFLSNVTHAKLQHIDVTGFSGALLNTSNVSGKGLDGAVAFTPPKVPDAIPAPATPYALK